MNDQVLPVATANLLAKIVLPDKTYLAGGTACALWLGHRQSVDLDFFVPQEFSVGEWRQKWEKEFDFKMFNQDWQTLEGQAGNVKLAMYYYKYPLIEPVINFKNIKIASIEDLTAMKLETLINRGTKRDFVDLYFLFKKFSLKVGLDYYDRKYGNIDERELLIKKALVYFDEAEEDEMPKMLAPAEWESIKKYFDKIAL
jgi:predicted nucleotidyltransferase component of viral defense system